MSNILNGITEAKRSPEPDYNDPSWDEKVSNVGQKAKQAEVLKSKGKEPKTRWNPETKKYYVDFSDVDESVGLPYPGTYEETNDMFKGSGQRRIGTLTTENDDPFRGTSGRFNRGDDERHDLDPSDWYIVKDGKMFAASIYPRQVQQAIAQGFSRTKQEARAKASSEGVAEGPQDPQSELKLINQKLKDAYKHVRNNSSVSIGWYMSQVKELNARREELIKQLRQGVAEGLGKDIKRLATGKDVKSRAGQEIAKSQDASMKGDTKTSKKHFDRYDKLDKLANKEQGVDEEKQRLDPKCWTGKHKEGTKMKGGVRVNNCVPNESAIMKGIKV